MTAAAKPAACGTGKARRQTAHPLAGLRSVGPATRRDLALLNVHDMAALAASDPQELYDRLNAITGVRTDPCVLDVFACAVAQARDPALPAHLRDWFRWTPFRKADRLGEALPPPPET